jgi:heat shock protein HslJ
MTDDAGEVPVDDADAEAEVPDNRPEEKPGFSFYASLALIGLLVVMIVVINYPAARANAGATMAERNWTLQSLMDTTGILIPAQSGTSVTVRFDRAGQMTGSAGCNQYRADYQALDYGLNITGISSTEMFCTTPGVMEQEAAFLADLSATSSFRVGESYLKFYDTAGKVVLAFGPG